MENQANEFTPEEAAYFESGGTTEVTAEPAVADTVTPPPAEITKDVAPRDENGKFIPHSVFHAEREEHKKTKSQLDEISRKQAVLEDRWNTLLQFKEQPKQDVQAPPDPNEDIFAYSKWQGERLKELEDKVTGREKQEEQQRTVLNQEREIWNHWSESAKSYAAEKADFGDAVTFLSDARTRQLKAFADVDDSFASEQGILNQINAELKNIVSAAKAKGQNPAAVVYQIAAAYGYAPTQQSQQDPARLELPAKLAQIDAAQNASKTLASAGGRSATDPMTPEAIASMSHAEFDTWMKNPENAKRFNQIMGG
ncbi:MAG: hypothetical protein AAAC47_06840 [Pararhizobium sp.]